MDCLPDKEAFCQLLNHYGAFAIFGLLALGIIALPIPEETLMVFSGALIEQGHLPLFGTLIAAYAGSITGISVSYLLGRGAGTYFLEKHGKWFGFSEEKIAYVHSWFQHYGTWALFFGYFIPGVRHFTGFIAGVTLLEYPSFAFFAYLGAFFWVSTFISIGYYFGNFGLQLFEFVELRFETISLIVIPITIIYFIYRYFKKKR